MRLTIESTGVITTIDGVPCRLWRGRTDSGREVDVFIHRFATADPAAQRELEADLLDQGPPVELEMAEIERRRLADQAGLN
jgi:hypothetical protein